MLRTYGRGRSEQFRVNPTSGSVLNFVPPALLVYLLALPFLIYFWGAIAAVLLAAYGVVVLLQVLALIPRGGTVRSLCASPLIVLTHILYGFGFLHGLFTNLKKPPAQKAESVVIEKIE
jgi:hypothetical protein